MKITKTNHARAMLCSCMLLLCYLPQQANALEFGLLSVQSYVSQALKLQASLHLKASENIQNITIRLATVSEYKALGVPFSIELKTLKLQLINQELGLAKLEISSNIAFNKSELRILIKVKPLAQAAYFKVYKVHLKVSKASSLDTSWAKQSRYGPVKQGDNLSRIAMSVRQDKRFTNRQVMLALYEANQNQFYHQDIHQLKLAAWLDIPKAAVIQALGDMKSMQYLDKLLNNVSKVALSPLKNTPPQSKSALGKESFKILISEQDFLKTSQVKLTSIDAQLTDVGQRVRTDQPMLMNLQQGITALKHDTQVFKQRQSIVKEQQTSYWQWAFYVLLLLMGIAVVILTIILWLKSQKTQHIDLEHEHEKTQRIQTVESEVLLQTEIKAGNVEADDHVVDLLALAESSLKAADYLRAEQCLKQILKQSPQSLKAAALQVKLYHETEQLEQRNELINTMSESSDAEAWQCFCDLLSDDVWQACFGEKQ